MKTKSLLFLLVCLVLAALLSGTLAAQEPLKLNIGYSTWVGYGPLFIAQEEAFGPVLTVFRFSGEAEALRLANDSKYGLAAMVWTRDEEKAQRVSKKIQSGIVWVNTYGGFYNEASFGGTKQSGCGRELGIEGLLEYTQTKHVCIDHTPGGKSLAASWF